MNYPLREMSCKIVYYGPAMGGKTTSLRHVHAHADRATCGTLMTLGADAERMVCFDAMPLEVGALWGCKVRLQLYTVPGRTECNDTRRLILGGVDGLVFVADAQRGREADNAQSLSNLRENLAEEGHALREIPHVLQYNKVDLPDAVPVEELRGALNLEGALDFEASAREGVGVFAPLKAVSRQVVEKMLRTGACPRFDGPPSSARGPASAWRSPVSQRGSCRDVSA
ncbi:GTP-binding protein [Chondromyces apiculatus]|uniref:GTP-binding protein n=1 Tax=Chondromyces apiculatus TaxID=51 RepID=UPI0018CC6360|nr:GTPase domain-containing protein [Chondromyces apiculatus]